MEEREIKISSDRCQNITETGFSQDYIRMRSQHTVQTYEDVSKNFRTESITKYKLTFGITR
jgi:transcription initiation factor TFIID subunit TAF12